MPGTFQSLMGVRSTGFPPRKASSERLASTPRLADYRPPTEGDSLSSPAIVMRSPFIR